MYCLVDTSQEHGLHVDEHCWTLDKAMASLSTFHLGLWLGWQILLNLVKLCFKLNYIIAKPHYMAALYMLGNSRCQMDYII